MNIPKYKFPVWGTQGGGLVREINDKFFFVEAPPEHLGLTVGDEMPQEWDRIPANEQAHESDMAHGQFTGGYRDPNRTIRKL